MAARAPANDDNNQAGPLAPIVPLFDRLAQAVQPGHSNLYRDRVFRPEGSPHTYIALPTPGVEAYEDYLPVARRLLDRHWHDSGDVKGDVLRAVVTILNKYVPEYAAAAGPVNQTGVPERMPRVVISFSDGQHIGLGRPHSQKGVLCTAFDRESAFTWAYEPHKPDYGLTPGVNEEAWRYRRIDKECEALYDTTRETWMMKPVEEILAAILAATDDSREKILNIVDPAVRNSVPAGPLRIENPRLA